MIRISAFFGVVLLLVVVETAHPREPVEKVFAISRGGTLTLMVPESLGNFLEFSSADGKSSLTFGPGESPSFLINIYMVIPAGVSDSDFMRSALRRHIEGDLDRYAISALETDVEIRKFDGPYVSGYTFSLTDRAPQAGGYKHLTEIMVRSGRLVITGYVLTNDGASVVAEDATEMLRNAYYEDE